MAIYKTDSDLTFKDRLDHFLARWGYKRSQHRIEPGLYALGNPDQGSPVFVTANYTLSFDALRSSLKGIDCYILVLNTYGINVWCAAGKGTFGTEELMNRIKVTGLETVVAHRKVILPQLGAAGVSAFTVKKECGWEVKYGPVRARDLPEYLKDHTASKEMRTVRFGLQDRLAVVPIEIVGFLPLTAVAAILLFIAAGLPGALMAVTIMLGGTTLFPILMPYIPVKDFSAKGMVLGLILSLPFAYYALIGSGDRWMNALSALGYVLVMMAGTGYLALNFTGSSTFTSRTGVRKEIYRYIPPMAGLFTAGVLIFAGFFIARIVGAI
jgi:hypothetical protein